MPHKLHSSTTYTHLAYCYRPNIVICRSVCRSVSLSHYIVSFAKNGWSDRVAVWMEDSGRPKEPHMGSRYSPWERGNFEGETGEPVCSIETVCGREKTAELIDLLFVSWTRVGRRMYKFNRIRQAAPMCPHRRAHSPPDEYDWNVRLRRRCGLMSNNFDHLLLYLQNWCPKWRPCSRPVNTGSVYGPLVQVTVRTHIRTPGRLLYRDH